MGGNVSRPHPKTNRRNCRGYQIHLVKGDEVPGPCHARFSPLSFSAFPRSPSADLTKIKMGRVWGSAAAAALEDPKQFVKELKVVLEVYRNPNPTKIGEKSEKVMFFRTPTMRAKAKVTLPPVPLGQIWTIGWIQSCKYISFVNVYNKLGFSSWEFPQLNMGLPGINDSDGESYPFYGNTKETYQIAGPILTETSVTVSMVDSPASYVTWKAPSKHSSNNESPVDLSCIRRRQAFNAWLVAYNEVTGECFELRCLHWEVDINIKVDRLQVLGKRTSLEEPKLQKMPCVHPQQPRIPTVVMSPPDANHAQMLLWRSHLDTQGKREIGIIVAPQISGQKVVTECELKNPYVYELAKSSLNTSSVE